MIIFIYFYDPVLLFYARTCSLVVVSASSLSIDTTVRRVSIPGHSIGNAAGSSGGGGPGRRHQRAAALFADGRAPRPRGGGQGHGPRRGHAAATRRGGFARHRRYQGSFRIRHVGLIFASTSHYLVTYLLILGFENPPG